MTLKKRENTINKVTDNRINLNKVKQKEYIENANTK